jgi:hypothetical protein
MQRFSISRGAAVLALAVLAACDSPIEAPIQQQPEELAAMVAALGFRGDMVQDMGDYVLVEGDIRFSKADLRAAQRPAEPAGPLSGPRMQYTTTALVSLANVNYITVNLNALAGDPTWANAARTAFGHWNGITSSMVWMVETTGAADITVSPFCNSTSGTLAEITSWPSGGKPGQGILVNTCWRPSNPATQSAKVHAMVHELGHTIGFRHTNWSQRNEQLDPQHSVIGAVHVPGTPQTQGDANSVMNGGVAGAGFTGFSGFDLVAIRNRYPLGSPSVGVTYPGSANPVISWTPVSGASTYYVILEVERWHPDGTYELDRISVDATTGTSSTDWNRTYTAIGMCDFPGGLQEIYSYRVETFVGNKRTSGLAPAEIGVC